MTRSHLMPTIPDDVLPVHWEELEDGFQRWLTIHGVVPHHLVDGREGSVWTLDEAGVPRYVLKNWKSPPLLDANTQFFLLRHLASDVPVAAPAGWGRDAAGRPVLATAYAGRPARASEDIARDVGRLLTAIHAVPMAGLPLDRYPAPLLPYHLGSIIEDYPDLASIARWAMQALPPSDIRLVHGDYHLGNIVVQDRSLAVLDWSEARFGDWRLDLAWAHLLTVIYHGPAAGISLLEGYAEAAGSTLENETLAPYEVLAGVRWILLARTAPVPIPAGWNATAQSFVIRHLPVALREIM